MVGNSKGWCSQSVLGGKKHFFFFFRVGSNKHNGLYLTGLIKDFASNSVKLGKKKKALVHLIFPKAKISLRSSWKERGEKETKIKKRSLFEA